MRGTKPHWGTILKAGPLQITLYDALKPVYVITVQIPALPSPAPFPLPSSPPTSTNNGRVGLPVCWEDGRQRREARVPLGGGQEVEAAVGQRLVHRGQDLRQDTAGQRSAGFLQDRGRSAPPAPRGPAISCLGCLPTQVPRRSPWHQEDLRLRGGL